MKFTSHSKLLLAVLTGLQVLFMSLSLQASPFPGFSTSETRNFYQVSPWIKFGIRWNIPQKDWSTVTYSQTSEILKFENANLNQSISLKLLLNRKAVLSELSAKNFSQFGFNLLKTQLVGKIDVIDLFHPEQKIQVRQYVYRKAKQPFVITCSSPPKIFSQTLIKCNQVALNIQWKELATEPALHFGSDTSNQTRIRR